MDDEQRKNLDGEEESTGLKQSDGITNNEINKSERMKIQSVSLADFLTADQIRGHLLSFTPQNDNDVSGNRLQSIGQNPKKLFHCYSIMSPILQILSCILILYMFPSVSAATDLSSYRHYKKDQKPRLKPTPKLSSPLIGDDQKIYICFEKNLLIFHNNGSISRTIPLSYKCNGGIPPVLGASRKLYLVAGNRVLRINTMKTQARESAAEVWLGPETGVEGMNEIIGLSVSITSSCVLVNIKRQGLFSYNYDGKLRWSTGPVISRLGFRQGCWKNMTGCYFVSAPVIDHCDANIYMLNNQGELYSVSIRSPHFKWIRNLNSFGNNFTVTAGNNGKLYVTVADSAIVLGLNVETGIILWQQSIGPLSIQDPEPVCDVNGWISIGSLDGFLYSISPSGILKKFPRTDVNDTVMGVNPVLDCSGYAVYISQTNMDGKISHMIGGYTYVSALKPMNATFKLLVPATGFVYWVDTYPGIVSDMFYFSDLRRYHLDVRVLLAFLSMSNIGNPLSCFTTRQRLTLTCSMMETKHVTLYTGNEREMTLFLFFETILLIILVILVRFCCVFWKKKKVQTKDLGKFLDKRNSLRIQKKVFDRTITELQKKAAEGTSTNEVVEKIGDLVREREGIERKLSTTYSLGKDATSLESKSLIPLSAKKTPTFSYRNGKKESVTMFRAISDSSTENGSSNDEVEKRELKGKAPMEIENSSDDEALNIVQTEVKILDEGNDQRDLQSGGRSMRRRSLSLPRNISSSN